MQTYERAQAGLVVRSAFEDAIADTKPADAALVAAFWRYARFELSQAGKDANRRARTVLERALVRFPVTVELWKELAWQMEAAGGAGVDAAAAAVYARATRNCPWCGALWAGRLRALERLAEARGGAVALGAQGGAGREVSEYQRVYEAALAVR
jgi:hypothetical protein